MFAEGRKKIPWVLVRITFRGPRTPLFEKIIQWVLCIIRLLFSHKIVSNSFVTLWTVACLALCSVHGISQARILEWVSFSRGSSLLSCPWSENSLPLSHLGSPIIHYIFVNRICVSNSVSLYVQSISLGKIAHLMFLLLISVTRLILLHFNSFSHHSAIVSLLVRLLFWSDRIIYIFFLFSYFLLSSLPPPPISSCKMIKLQNVSLNNKGLLHWLLNIYYSAFKLIPGHCAAN